MLSVDPCSHFFLFEAAKWVTAGKIKKKKALCLDNLNKCLISWIKKKNNLADQHLSTIALIAFFGFMRFSEVSRLRRSDLVFSSTYVKAFIEKIKTVIKGKECGFTFQLLIRFVHWNNLNIIWLSQKYLKIQRSSFSET